MWPLGLVIDVFPGNGEVVQIANFLLETQKQQYGQSSNLRSLPLH